MLREVWLLWDSDKIVEGVHAKKSCKGFCPVHNPSSHLLRSTRIDYDSKTNCFVRICEHNRTHIDPDEANYWILRTDSSFSESLRDKARTKLWSFLCPSCDCGCCDITRKVFT